MARTFTAAATTAIAKKQLTPVMLASFAFATGTVNVATQTVTADSVAYSGIIASVGKVENINADSGIFGIAIPALTLRLVNTQVAPFSDYLKSNVARKTLVTLKHWFVGESLVTSDIPEADRYYIEGFKFDEVYCEIRLVGELYRKNKQIGTRLNAIDDPGIAPKSVGRTGNIIYGQAKNVRADCIVAGGADILAVALTKTATSITISHLPNAKRFPTGGTDFTIQIHREQIRITNYNDTTGVLTVAASGRGYNGTQAADHGVGRALWEVLSTYDYLVADHAVKAIGDIFVNGSKVLTGATKILTPKAKIQLSPDLTLESGVDMETVAPGLLHGDNDRTVRFYGSLESGAANTNIYSVLPSTTPTLGPVKSVTVYLRVYNYGAAVTNYQVHENGTGMTLDYTGLTMQAGENTYILPASAVTASMTWQAALKLNMYSTTVATSVLEVYFDVTYDGTGTAPVKVLNIAGPIGVIAGGVPSYSHTLEIATDTETLGDIVGISCHMTARNEGVALTFGCDVTGSPIDFAVEDMTFPATSTQDIVAGATAFTAAANWASDIEIDIDGTGLIIDEITFRVLYQDADYFKPGGVSLDGLNAAAIEIGDRITCDCDGYADDVSGTYTGTASALIEVPADVINHFSVIYGSLTVSSDFATARTSHASAGFVFAGVIRGRPLFVDVITRMKNQCRLHVWHSRGSLRCKYIPDSPASQYTVDKDAIRERRFTVSGTTKPEIINTAQINYDASWGTFSGEPSQFYGLTAEATDSTSVTDNGTCDLPPELSYCEWITASAMATNIRDDFIARFKNSMDRIPFVVDYDYLKMEEGDFFAITHDSTVYNYTASTIFMVVAPPSYRPGGIEQTQQGQAIRPPAIEIMAVEVQ